MNSRQGVPYASMYPGSADPRASIHAEDVGKCVGSVNSQEFLRFLKRLYRRYPGRHLHVIADNLATHTQEDVRKWVAKRKRLTLHFAPTYASWLNRIEIWFNIFTRDVLYP